MSKKNLAVIFLLLSGAIAVLAYAAWNQSNWLTDNQINFTDKLSTNHGNKLTAMVRDSLMNGLTTRAQNHESRLQAFSQSTGYPNLTTEQTNFSDLLSTNPKNNNMLTAEMRNGLLNRLTNAVTNHEMRLRALEEPKTTETYHCSGQHTTSDFYREWKLSKNVLCLGRTKHDNRWLWGFRSSYDERACEAYKIDMSNPGATLFGTQYKRGIFDPTSEDGISTNCMSIQITTEEGKEVIGNIIKLGPKPKSCKYQCDSVPAVGWETYCDKIHREVDCGSLNELACKNQVGCRWVKG